MTFNHAIDVAFEVVSEHGAESLTFEEVLSALKARVSQIERDHDTEALLGALPFDTYEIEAN